MKRPSSENVFHFLKGGFGLLISVGVVFIGLDNKCPLQPQLPFWSLGTSVFLFLGNLSSLIFKNVSAVKSQLMNIKKDHRDIGRFLDHFHGFFYSTFLIWVIPGFQWVYSSYQSNKYKSCDSTVQRLSLLLLSVLFLEVVLRSIHFGYTLIRTISKSKVPRPVSPKANEIENKRNDDDVLSRRKLTVKKSQTSISTEELDKEVSKLANQVRRLSKAPESEEIQLYPLTM
eukprot:GFUD01010228.1.p1 GENE.GFUD01010228.1~~GFUD01010228.1.p1  ORF type:complete len:229 (+),score=34.86 GFUD01010228.1:69-755(+)